MKCEWCGAPEARKRCHMDVCDDCFDFVGMYLEKPMRFLIFSHTTVEQRKAMREEFNEANKTKW